VGSCENVEGDTGKGKKRGKEDEGKRKSKKDNEDKVKTNLHAQAQQEINPECHEQQN
jgi:hypothetical protein